MEIRTEHEETKKEIKEEVANGKWVFVLSEIGMSGESDLKH